MRTLPKLIRKSLAGTGNWEYMARYLCVGACCVFVDLATFQLLITLHVWLPVTTTVAFVMATATHFSLNKMWTFRVRGKPHGYQLGAYLTVLGASFLVSQAVILVSVWVFNFVPILAKILAIIIQFPVSFFGHRYFTFRHGREIGDTAYERFI
jgi:putative flippase GtrA